MKISKKKAIQFAADEYILRNGDWETLEDDPTWTVEDEVEKEGVDHWMESPAGIIATMMFDGLFNGFSKKELSKYKKFYGAKLWQEALEAYATGDHDT
jgi:hypothetical protein